MASERDPRMLSQQKLRVLREYASAHTYPITQTECTALFNHIAAQQEAIRELRKELIDAGQSLRYISTRRLEKDETAHDWLMDIRGYSNSRANVVDAILAKHKPEGL